MAYVFSPKCWLDLEGGLYFLLFITRDCPFLSSLLHLMCNYSTFLSKNVLLMVDMRENFALVET